MSTNNISQSTSHFLAIDLGAGSGRGMLATLSGETIELEEIHRFPNHPVRLRDTLHWDFPFLFQEVKVALSCAAHRLQEHGVRLDGISVDTWGIDYGLLDRRGDLLGNPVNYRDARTDGVMERVFKKVPKQRIFDATGILFMQFNTLYQLAAELERDPQRLKDASKMLFIPDLFHYFLCGATVTEPTIVSLSQLGRPGATEWCHEVLDAIGIPSSILPEIGPSPAIVGKLHTDIASYADLDPPPPVIAGASHDTASAVAAVPALADEFSGDETWAYLSSGTWSLMGVELPEPLVNDDVLRENYTNEVGVNGTIRFLKVLTGLWLIQESRRVWKEEGRPYDFSTLTELAQSAPSFTSLVDPDDPVFFKTGDIPQWIRDFCQRTRQPGPSDDGATIRCALESLALNYAYNADRIAALTGKRITRLHVVGGGSKNKILNQFTANALGIEIVAGPAEATALGNALLQAVAVGSLTSLGDVRRVVRNSVTTEQFLPEAESASEWAEARKRFSVLKA